ncbi:DUF4333 domain-containing protein [Halostreptopolyspora alba]|uniref:DUF4333 domain-containing protein n=1 Tax=Halostreptopolyspora alba TaxID=2487137 RepID=UPI0037187DFE
MAVLSVTSCGLFSAETVDSEEVANEAAKILEQQVGQAPDDMTCDEDLPAEVDASIRCELTTDGTAYGVTVTITNIDGNNIELDVQVDDEPLS